MAMPIGALDFSWAPYTLDFNFEARTSRAVMRTKTTYFLRVALGATGDVAYGEVPLFEGLSAECSPDFEERLSVLCRNGFVDYAGDISCINFGLHSALAQLAGQPATDWSLGIAGIPINGLVWMGDKATMLARVEEKIEAGFGVLKLKIGGIDFEDELDIIRSIRRRFSPEVLELRLDANGSFTTRNALPRLERLAPFGIHSLEQPIRAGQIAAMRRICRLSPICIALDEELIGCRAHAEAKALLTAIRPQYIILKPSLCGGFGAADDYISMAEEMGIGWWATSALESNVGLYAIARWLSCRNISMPQGLGTGLLYTNNFVSPLELRGASLFCSPDLPLPVPEGLLWRK